MTKFTSFGYAARTWSTIGADCAQNGHWKSENIVMVTGAFLGPRTAEFATGISYTLLGSTWGRCAAAGAAGFAAMSFSILSSLARISFWVFWTASMSLFCAHPGATRARARIAA